MLDKTDFETNFEADLQSDALPTPLETRLEPFHMRCPNCRKLYSVDASLLGVGSADVLKFECAACRTAFLALKPELHGQHFVETELLVTELTALADAPEAVSSPAKSELEVGKVVGSVVSDESARSATSTVPLREHPMHDLELSESAELIALWATIMDNYEDVSAHETFLNRCFVDERLAFATHKYAQILVLDPRDDMARRMRRRAIGLASFGFDATSRGLTRASWNIQLPSFNNLITLLGAIAVMVGLGLPNMRQIAGLGFAMIALSLGLRYFLRRPSGT